MSFTDVNEHTKKMISNKQYKSMGKFSVTTPDKSTIALEKTFAMEGSGSLLTAEKKETQKKESSFKEEIEALKKLHNIGTAKKPVVETNTIKESKKENLKVPENKVQETKNNEESTEIIKVPSVSNEAMQMVNAVIHAQNHIVAELTDVFDKRLEKFDDIIMDLIRCKTENERLKQKNDNLTRDNYKFKKEVESYKSIIPGLYIRKELDKTKF